MSLIVRNPGMQTTLQGRLRENYRHFGVPWSGPADPLSLSLANRLVGAPADQLGLEITLTGAEFEFTEAVSFALTGAEAKAALSGRDVQSHLSYTAKPGDILKIGPAEGGARTYLALSAQLQAEEFLGSSSTYLPAGFGGLQGRALKEGDVLEFSDIWQADAAETPTELRPHFNDAFLLQVCEGPDFGMISQSSGQQLFDSAFKATQRSSRMGLELKGEAISIEGVDSRPSSAVFPGCVQCPPDGNPFVLLADAQTTGGYPHILQVIRSDRFQLGQIKPGATVHFVRRSPQDAMERYRTRLEAYSDWMSSPII